MDQGQHAEGQQCHASKAVLDYLNRQNRPYSAVDIFNNLHKEYGKTAVVKVCESLALEGKLAEKINGKQKVYLADQKQFPDVDESEIKKMDQLIVDLSEKVKKSQEEVKLLESELRTLNNSISTEDASLQTHDLTSECTNLEAKLDQLRQGGELIPKEEREKIYNNRTKYVKEWRKRKRIGTDILNAILEGYPKTKKQLFEEIGIETDEEYNVSPPQL